MTLEEHKLLVLLHYRQLQHITFIIELLKNKGVIQNDDLKAFESLLKQDAQSSDYYLRWARASYVAQATRAGLNIPEGLDFP